MLYDYLYVEYLNQEAYEVQGHSLISGASKIVENCIKFACRDSKQNISRIVVKSYLYGISLITTITNVICRIYAQWLQLAHSLGLLLFQGVSLTDSFKTSRKELAPFQRHFWGVGKYPPSNYQGLCRTEE